MDITASKIPTELNTITSQPLLSSNVPLMPENNNETPAADISVPANIEMTSPSLPQQPTEAVTTQPLLHPTEEEQEKRLSQSNPSKAEPEKEDATEDACWFCIPLCDIIENIIYCDLCCHLECCSGCCEDGCYFCCSCCEACCEAGDAAGAVDGGEIAECCGSCFECCSS